MGEHYLKPLKPFEEWLRKAEEDYRFAGKNLEDNEFYPQICFHFHQASEKYLKAAMIGNGLKFRPVHDLIELLNVLKEFFPDTAWNIENDCNYINPFYIETRYPVHWPTNYDKKTAESTRNSAKKIRLWVRNKLKVKNKKTSKVI